MRIIRIDPDLRIYLAAFAAAWDITFEEALRRTWEADEFVIVNGLARFIKPTHHDGRIEG